MNCRYCGLPLDWDATKDVCANCEGEHQVKLTGDESYLK